jgi:hypothetical protein
MAQNKPVDNEDISDDGRHREEHNMRVYVALNCDLEGDQVVVGNSSQERHVQGRDWLF